MNGYKGIMALDLSAVDPKFHKELIQLHQADIREYKLDQAKRKPKDRYDNSVGRALKNIKHDNMLRIKRMKINEGFKIFWICF